MHRVALYTRISLDEDKQKYSLGAQKERLEAFCHSQFDDWQIFKIYRDTESGTHLNRPGLQEMLSDAQHQKFDTLLVLRVDRLSRKVRELALLVDELTKCDVHLRSTTEPFDTGNPAGKMMLQMLGVFAEFEHSTIIERTKIGMEKKAKEGQWPGGRVPLGYSYDPDTSVVINVEEASTVRRIFKLYSEGREGSSAICDRLNAAGYRKRSGKKFDRKALLHILRNPFYTGHFRWKKVVYEGSHEPIVTEKVFQEANRILKQRSEDLVGRRWHNKNQRLLTGLIRCSRCNSRMVGASAKIKSGAIPYYVCLKRLNTKECDQDYVRADKLEERVLSEIQAIFRDEALLASIWEKAQKKLAAEEPDIEDEIYQVDAQLRKARSTLDRYFAAFEAGTMKPEACNSRVEALSTQIGQLEGERVALKERRCSLDLPAIKHDFLDKILTDLQGIVEAVPNPQKKHLLHLLVKKVLVRDKRTVEIWYRLPQGSPVRTLSNLVAPTGLEPVLPP